MIVTIGIALVLAMSVPLLVATDASRASSATCGAGECDPLCVEPGRYEVTPDIAYDTANARRLWQRRAAVRLAHDAAARYCSSLVLQGIGGWRLPTTNELASLRYKPGGLFGGGGRRHFCVPCLDQAAFPETPAAEFWTSRTEPDGTAWYVGFDDGRSHKDVKSDELWVRCVHEPLP
jgi:hypothetical protein